jgi:hypothetical protein
MGGERQLRGLAPSCGKGAVNLAIRKSHQADFSASTWIMRAEGTGAELGSPDLCGYRPSHMNASPQRPQAVLQAEPTRI